MTGDDYARLGEAAEEFTTWHGNQVYLRMEAGHCAALELDGAAGSYACKIYDRRPAICRELDRGSAACHGERATKDERAVIALRLHRGD